MANRIKGITVEIGGDTTGLDKALKSVNTSIRTTQSALKDVNRLLKLDPSNTELLSQKQRLLKDAIAATKEKLDSLKVAQEQAKQQLENGELGQDKYDALQREIVETEEELRRLQQEAATTNTALSKIDVAGQKMEAVGNSIAGAGKKMMGVTTVIGGVGVAAVKTAADFDSAMSLVAAVSGATGKDFDALRNKAREMGAKTKFSATEAAEAMNYMAMAGWKTEDMLSGIEGIMNLAAASGEDLATTSDIVTDALTAFGLSAKDSGHFADILAAASSNANTNVSMMGETFKYCAPIAGALGFSAEDTAEAIGLMANAGIKSSQAGTALRTIMNNLAGDVKISGKAIGDVTIATTNADGSMRDLSDILADCRSAFGNLTESEKAQAAESLVGKNAMSGFLALMNAGEGDIEKLSSAIENCDGSAEKMAMTMQDNLAGQLTILKSQLQELAISFGDILMPAIRSIVSKLQGFVDKLNGMDEGTKRTIVTIALLVASIGPLLIIIGTAISKIGVAMQGFVKLANGISKLKVAVQGGAGVLGKLGGISAPVLAVVAVIAVLVAAFVHLWKTNEGFRDAIIGTWNRIKDTISGFCQGIVDRLNALGFQFTDIVDVLKTVWDGFCQVLAPIFEGVFNNIANILSTVTGVITGILDVFIGIFTGNWSQAWNGIKEIFSSIWNGISSFFSNILNVIKGVADVVLGWFGTSWNEVWTNIKTFFEGIWNGIATFFTTIWETLKNVVTVGIMAIGSILSAAFNIITLPFRFIWENCKEIIISVWDAIKSKVTTVIHAVASVISTVMNAIKTVFTTVWNAIKTVVTTVVNAIKSVVTTVFNAIKSTATTVWNAIKTAVTTPVNAIKSTVTSVFNSVKSTVASIFNGIKSTATSVWNGIKTAITTPIEAAKNKVKSVVDAIKGFFSGMKITLPHIKLPHFKVTGKLSIAPPSVPHLSIDWYKEGGIMTSPTIFGMNGSSLMAGGEAGAEAILPLAGFYKQLEAMISSHLNTSAMEKYLAVIADNSSKGIYLEDGTLVGHLLPVIDGELGKAQKLQRRLSL